MFFIIKVASGSASGSLDHFFFSGAVWPWGLAVPSKRTPPAENPAASKTHNKSFGGFSNFKFIFQVHNFCSALRWRFFLNALHFTNCASIHARTAQLSPKLLFWIAKNIVFPPHHSIYRAYSPTKKLALSTNQNTSHDKNQFMVTIWHLSIKPSWFYPVISLITQSPALTL